MSDDCCLAALSPSTPRAYGATLRASGVDRSARPSKEGYHVMNADKRLALFNRTYDVLNKGNCPIENAAKKNSTKKLLTCGAPYKPNSGTRPHAAGFALEKGPCRHDDP